MAEDYFFSTLSKFRKDDSFTVEDKNSTLPQNDTPKEDRKASAALEKKKRREEAILQNRKTRAKCGPSENGFQTILVGFLDYDTK